MGRLVGHAIAPSVEAVATKFKGSAVVGKVNLDENPELALKYGIQSIPTMLFFHQGTVVDHVIGAVPRANLRDRLNQLLHA